MSTFIIRFEALTGGEDGGAVCLGVIMALTLGTGTLPRGILGVCIGGCSGIARSMTGSGEGGDLVLDLRILGGVLGSVTSDLIAGIGSASESSVITVAPGGTNFAGFLAIFAVTVVDVCREGLFAMGLSSCTGLDARQDVGL
jgi:hypothetical protein